jgi:Uma2 family endonuclease
MIPVPRSVRFPVELSPPAGFDPSRLETWPKVEGRLEYVGGRLLYMPPCGVTQGKVVPDIGFELLRWVREHAGFVLLSHEAGMRLGEDTRAVDVGIWRATDLVGDGEGLTHAPPVLAIEVAGKTDTEDDLREKARWYLGHGVATVWIVLPSSREVVVIAAGRDEKHGLSAALPEPEGLAGLAPPVSSFFVQLLREG